MSRQPRSPRLTAMIRAAVQAGRGLMRDFRQLDQLEVERKGNASDFVSSADKKSEEVLLDALQKMDPGAGIVSEESHPEANSQLTSCWIVDPLDGTANFLHALPFWAISIAYLKEGRLETGLVYNVPQRELFVAERNKGAFLDGKRISVSGKTSPDDALFATGIPYRGFGDKPRFARQLAPVMENSAGVRRLGACALDLAYVAAGRFDGFWESGVSSWDMAAGCLLVEEAGGEVSDFQGGGEMFRRKEVVASTPELFRRFLAWVREDSPAGKV